MKLAEERGRKEGEKECSKSRTSVPGRCSMQTLSQKRACRNKAAGQSFKNLLNRRGKTSGSGCPQKPAFRPNRVKSNMYCKKRGKKVYREVVVLLVFFGPFGEVLFSFLKVARVVVCM